MLPSGTFTHNRRWHLPYEVNAMHDDRIYENYISILQEELVLAESTVKTHMSHIYAKLGVSGRQEMMDLLFGETKGGIDA